MRIVTPQIKANNQSGTAVLLVLHSHTAFGIIQNELLGFLRRFHHGLVHFLFQGYQRGILLAEVGIREQRLVNLALLLLRNLVVQIPDQIGLGKRLCHRHYG